MKKFSILFLLMIFTAGCSSTDRQQYIKEIMLFTEDDNFVISMLYYDFTRPEESYTTVTYCDADIYSLAGKVMGDGNYNFRLCDAVYFSNDFCSETINRAIYLVNSMRVSPSADVLFYTGENVFFAGENKIYSPLYDLSVKDNKITADIPLVDSGGRHLGTVVIKNGAVVQFLTRREQLVLGMVMNTVDECGFTFHDGNLWAYIENINTAFHIKNNILNVVINMTVKERKGMSNSIETKHISDMLMAKEISNTVYELFDDIGLQYNYNLHWYCLQKGRQCDGIKVTVNIN